VLLAEVAAAEGDAAEAARQTDVAWKLEPSVLARETQARVYAAAGRAAEAIPLFEEVLRRQAQRLDSYDAPGFHRVVEARYRLAALLDDAGERARATPHLETLLELWEGVDPELPAAADARRRLARAP
jgi:tetratricopeptide (TPR) repeat protein